MLLASHAYEMVHAIVLTLVRMVITQRRLLEWETAAATTVRAAGLLSRQGPWVFLVEMWAGPAIALTVLLGVLLLRPGALHLASPFLVGVAGLAGSRLVAEPAGGREALGVARRRRGAAAAGCASNLVLLRALRRRAGPLAAARQRAERTGTAHRAPNVADQYRHGPALDARRARPGVLGNRAAGGSVRGHPRDSRSPGAPRRAPAQLVRHGEPRPPRATLRLDRGQRQSGRSVDGVGGGAARNRRGRRRRRTNGARGLSIPRAFWPKRWPRWSAQAHAATPLRSCCGLARRELDAVRAALGADGSGISRVEIAGRRAGDLRAALDEVVAVAPAGPEADAVAEWGRALDEALVPMPEQATESDALRRPTSRTRRPL